MKKLSVVRSIILACLLSILAVSAFAQTKLKLSAIKPGTERVQLINNGDFQFQGPLGGTNYPSPSGWSSRDSAYSRNISSIR